MAVFGIGASFGDVDMTDTFTKNNMVALGWSPKDAPSQHKLMQSLKVGDIVFIKSAPIGKGLRVKAVGIIIDNNLSNMANVGIGLKVKWVWTGVENLGNIGDKYNVRNVSLYEEFNPVVLKAIIDKF